MNRRMRRKRDGRCEVREVGMPITDTRLNCTCVATREKRDVDGEYLPELQQRGFVSRLVAKLEILARLDCEEP